MNKLLIILVAVAIAVWFFTTKSKEDCNKVIEATISGEWPGDDEIELQTGWANRNIRACENNPDSCTPCSARPEGMCTDSRNVGWNNSISGIPGSGMNVKPDGQTRIFKAGNYYGMGCASKFCYGEPYFARDEKY